jgi:hypothetical protein
VKWLPKLPKREKRTKEMEEVLSRNSLKYHDFSNKEVYLLLLDEMNKKLDKHIEITEDLQRRYIPEFNKQCEILSQICRDLPEKGFCGKMDKMYNEVYPTGEESLPKKITTLWYDRKIMKWLLATSLGALLVGLITLAFGFLKGVF